MSSLKNLRTIFNFKYTLSVNLFKIHPNLPSQPPHRASGFHMVTTHQPPPPTIEFTLDNLRDPVYYSEK